jgi:hypothetical protein
MNPKRGAIRNTVLLRRHQKGGIALQKVAQKSHRLGGLGRR